MTLVGNRMLPRPRIMLFELPKIWRFAPETVGEFPDIVQRVSSNTAPAAATSRP